MAKKKGTKRKKGRTTPSLPPEQSARLKDLLARPDLLDPSDIREAFAEPGMARALVDGLPAGDPELVPLLVSIREAFPEKEVQKAIRRTAFRFQQQGVTVPAAVETGGSILRKAPQQGEPFAILSPLDDMSAQGVLLALPREPMGYELGVGVASDEAGLLQFAGGTFSKKKALGARDEFREESPLNVEASIGHAVSILERAYRAEPNAPGTAHYLRIRPWLLDRVSLPEAPAAYELIDEEELSGRPFTESMAARLFEHDFLTAWFLKPETTTPLIEEIRKAEESPIVLSGDRQEGRIEEIKQEWIREYFDEARRSLFRQRLEETAFVLHRVGDEEEARIALLAARSLEEEDSRFHTNPFLRLLVERSLSLFQEEPGMVGDLPVPGPETVSSGDEEDPSPGIIIP